ncbi:hypothetical protein [Planobispora takensis]|uniref:Uncharacterized protein n=1 Tax=Planobispora takensis TaxID=1367882 RepID=A0A8J3WY31_9ACTN|nr:hypothetical protein [Planobispora takensis]GII05468.1 hypothetical protein Pta02_74760 [Planobispora takensis]
MTSLTLTVRVHLADVLVWARTRRLIATATWSGLSFDTVAAVWALCPANRCVHPGCSRCRDGR